jgi:flavin-dependent dehydrogenase
MKSAVDLRAGYDAVIVGARCAGAATALLLARAGLRVLAVDQSRYGSDTLSTHALMRGGVLQLHRWGLLSAIQAAGTPAVRRTSFHYGEEVVDIPIKPRDGVDALYAPRRTLLDALLVDAAREAGAEVAHGVRLVDVVRAGERVSGVLIEAHSGELVGIRAGMVIGADGLKSAIARRVGAGEYQRARHATSIVYGYWSGLEVGGYHWYYRPGVSAGAIPTNGGQTCVFVFAPPRRFREEIRHDIAAGYHRLLAESAPELARLVSRAQRAGAFHSFRGEPGFLRQSWGPGWALVGDAGYFKDPITAHGITDALRDAELLARAVAEGSESALADYQATRDQLSLGLFRATEEVASFEWDLPSLQRQHLLMSEEMGREVATLAALEGKFFPTPRGAVRGAVPLPSIQESGRTYWDEVQ